MKRSIAWAACLLAGWAASAQAQRAREIEAPITRVIARVSEVWTKGAAYDAFHAELKGKFEGTPELATFNTAEQWVTVISSPSLVYPGIFKGRGTAAMALKLGDIVEMRIAHPKDVKAYAELSEITRVVCRAGTPDYAECVKANPLTWFDKTGAVIPPPGLTPFPAPAVSEKAG